MNKVSGEIRGLARMRDDWRPAIRPEVLSRFDAALRQGADPGTTTRGFLVQGPARSGKTMLLSELAIYASTVGFETHHLAAPESLEREVRSGRHDLAEWIVDALVLKAGFEAVERALPSAGHGLLDRSSRMRESAGFSEEGERTADHTPGQSDEGARTAVWVAEALRRFSVESPVLIAVEDLERVSSSSLEFLENLLSLLGESSVLLVATVLDARDQRPERVQRKLDHLAAHEKVECIRVKPFDVSGLRRLLTVRGIEPLPDELLRGLALHCARTPGTAEVVAGWMAQMSSSAVYAEPERRMRVVPAFGPAEKLGRQA